VELLRKNTKAPVKIAGAVAEIWNIYPGYTFVGKYCLHLQGWVARKAVTKTHMIGGKGILFLQDRLVVYCSS
jgi:hypothetical protein